MKRINFNAKTFLDRIQIPAIILGLCFLFFTTGAIVAYFKLAPYPLLHDAYEGGSAWWKQIQSEEKTAVRAAKNKKRARRKKVLNTDKAYKGYTLIVSRIGHSPYLIDMNGKIVHRWNAPFRKVWPKAKHLRNPFPVRFVSIENLHLYPNGDLLGVYTGHGDSPWGYGMVKLDKNSKVLWTYDKQVHHKVFIHPDNGKIYALTHKYSPKKLLHLPSFTRGTLMEDFIHILSPDGTFLDSISILQAFIDTPYESYLYNVTPDSTFGWDILHTNNVTVLTDDMAKHFPMFKPGDLLVSLRNISTIAIIDPNTKKVKWAANGPWMCQHDAHFIDNGHILMFDNVGHYKQKRVQTRALEFDPKDSSLPWMYPSVDSTDRFLTPIFGHVQRLPNGNTLLAQSYSFRVFEVTKEGEIVWSYKLPSRKYIFDRGMALRKNDGWRSYPKGIMRHSSTVGASAITYYHRFSPEELPFIQEKLKKRSPKKK